MAEGSGWRVSWALGLGHSQEDGGWHRPRGHEQRRPWAALTPHAPRLTHSPAGCLHPASQALGLPDAQASGLTRPGCVTWSPAWASSHQPQSQPLFLHPASLSLSFMEVVPSSSLSPLPPHLLNPVIEEAVTAPPWAEPPTPASCWWNSATPPQGTDLLSGYRPRWR